MNAAMTLRRTDVHGYTQQQTHRQCHAPLVILIKTKLPALVFLVFVITMISMELHTAGLLLASITTRWLNAHLSTDSPLNHPAPLTRTVPVNFRNMDTNTSNVNETLSEISRDLESHVVSTEKSNTRQAENSGISRKLLTLFTTFKESGVRQRIHRNTLANWKALGVQGVDPVLFMSEHQNNSGWPDIAADSGWKVRRTSYIYHNVPILKYMFWLMESDGYDTPFLGYANDDILFDKDLTNTLQVVMDTISQDQPVLITGRRRNVDVALIPEAQCVACVTMLSQISPFFSTDAQDYFIVSRAGFPWERVPDFIVGWPGFDNWLVAMAIQWNIVVIDASYSINAIHQVGFEGVNSGWNNLDPRINLRMTPGFNYELGRTYCAPWRTIRSYVCLPSDGSCIRLLQRHPLEIPDSCQPTVRDLGAYTPDLDWTIMTDYYPN